MILWQQIHSDRHNYRSGEVAIAQSFTGNVLSVQVETKPEYDLSRQIIGWLYQYSGIAVKKFALISGNDVLFLALPETDRLEFIPTPYLNELYTLTINAANIEGSSNLGISGSIPDSILALPNRVLAVENGLTGATSLLSQVEADLSVLEIGLNAKSNLGHSHSISEINSLQSSLDNLSSSISGKANQSDLTGLTGRVTTLESGVTASFPKKVKLNGTGNRGLFWYLGTLGTDENFVDPIKSGNLFGLLSTQFNANFGVKNCVDRVSTNPAHTLNNSNSWLGFDIGVNRSILLDRYYLKSRIDFNGHHPRTWILEGTNSVSANTVAGFDAATWETIGTQTNFSGLTGLGLSADFYPSRDAYYRYLRLRLTGIESSGQNFLTLSAIEFFGVLKLTA